MKNKEQPTDPRPASPVGGEATIVPAKWTKSVEDYIAHYGSGCRDCADSDGVCPTDGRPCNPDFNRASYRHALKAIEYGLKHGYLAALSAPSVTGEAVAWRRRANATHPILGECWDMQPWKVYSEKKPELAPGLEASWFDVQPLYAAPVSAHEGGEANLPEQDDGEPAAWAIGAQEAASDEYAMHMGDPDGNDDIHAARMAAARMIELYALAALSPTAPAGIVSPEDIETLRDIARVEFYAGSDRYGHAINRILQAIGATS